MKYCASCGRSETGPDGADPVPDRGQLWCRRCADVRKTDSGNLYVAQPSPGELVDAKDDPFAAWRDCYSQKPKKRIRAKNAKAEIQRAWRLWDGDKTATNCMSDFYGWLCRYRPYFLTFRDKRGDPYQWVRQWVEREGPNLEA